MTCSPSPRKDSAHPLWTSATQKFGPGCTISQRITLPGMTVGELISALRELPQDLPVTRYCDEIVEGVELRDFSRDDRDATRRGPDEVRQYQQHAALLLCGVLSPTGRSRRRGRRT